MFSSGFSEMLIGWDNAELIHCAMGGQQCKEPQRSVATKRVHVEPVARGLTLLDDYYICSPPKKPKHSEWSGEADGSANFVVNWRESQAFHRLLADQTIFDFLQADCCRRISDKYLVAMVFTYFKRAEYRIHEYTRMNFFVALYLANDMEEDEEEVKYDIFPWALGPRWRYRYINFMKKREKLWQRISYRAVVSKKCCEEIMNLDPMHWAWKRERAQHHGGATRVYGLLDEGEGYIVRGPENSPRRCEQCFSASVQHDSGYFDEGSWYFSHSSSSESESSSPQHEFFCVEPEPRPPAHRFDMRGLKHTLQYDDWPFATEE